MWSLAFITLAALAFDLILHVATLIGLDPLDWIQPGWLAVLLFWGIFGAIVIIANIAEIHRRRRARAAGLFLSDPVSPAWFKILVGIVILYALLNPLLADWPIMRGGGQAVLLPNGGYGLDPGHGHPIEPITEAEYHAYRRSLVRTVTGLLLVFYLPIAFHLLCLATGRNLCPTTAPIGPSAARWILIAKRWNKS
jgi:hypothetical protein